MNSCVHKIIFGIVVTSLVSGSSVSFSMPKKSKQKSDDLVLQEALMVRQNEDSARRQILHDFPLVSRVFSEKDINSFNDVSKDFLKCYGNALSTSKSAIDLFAKLLLLYEPFLVHYSRYDELEAATMCENSDGIRFYVGGAAEKVRNGMPCVTKALFVLDTTDEDSLAVYHRMEQFVSRYVQDQMTTQTNSYSYPYDPSKDKEYLQGVIDDVTVSEDAHALARQFLAQGRLYSFQKELTPMMFLFAKMTGKLAVYIANPATPSLSELKHDLGEFGKFIVSLQKDPGKNNVKITDLMRKYEHLAHQIDADLQRVARLNEELKKEKAKASKGVTVQQKNRAARVLKKKELAATARQRQADCQGSSSSSTEQSIGPECRSDDFSGPLEQLILNEKTVLEAGNDQPTTQKHYRAPVVSELEAAPPIDFYNKSTVLDWFSDEGVKNALVRETFSYPNSNKTPRQLLTNVAAHTFPFEIDKFISHMAYSFDAGNGVVHYVIPGSHYNAKTAKKEIGYYSWIVKDLGVRGKKCFHRSFTIKAFDRDDRFADVRLYNTAEVRAIIKTVERVEGVAHENADKSVVPMCESGALEKLSSGLAVTIKDHNSGNIFRLIVT